MIILQKSFNKNVRKFFGLLFVLMLFQSCKAYKSPTSLEQAAKTEEKGFVKVTMVNGDEYIYESIELGDGIYYGVKTQYSEKLKTALLKEEVLKVERQNKKASGIFSFMGITVGVASVILGILMFGI